MSTPTSLGGLVVRRSSDLIDENTRVCGLVMAGPKKGKTTFCATMHNYTTKHMGKDTLIIALEAADGGGVTSVQEMDVPFVQPNNYQELEKVLSLLQADSNFGAVIIDNATDMVKRIVQPHVINMPNSKVKENAALRSQAGVPQGLDYETMAEFTRKIMNQLINLTKLSNPALRKHVLCTVLEKDKKDRDGNLISTNPALPGQMATDISAMFELYIGLVVKPAVVKDPNKPGQMIKIEERFITTKTDGVRQFGDRYKCFPDGGPADFEKLMVEYWHPKVAATQARRLEVKS